MRGLDLLAAGAVLAGGVMACGSHDARASRVAQVEPGRGAVRSADAARAKPPVDAAPRCLPVAECSMFRRPDLGLCAAVDAAGHVDLPRAARPQSEGFAVLERTCAGEPGAPRELEGCLDFVETQLSCRWRAPGVPAYRCGFVEGVCRNLDAP